MKMTKFPEHADYMLIPIKNVELVKWDYDSIIMPQIICNRLDGVLFLDTEHYSVNGKTLAEVIKEGKK